MDEEFITRSHVVECDNYLSTAKFSHAITRRRVTIADGARAGEQLLPSYLSQRYITRSRWVGAMAGPTGIDADYRAEVMLERSHDSIDCSVIIAPRPERTLGWRCMADRLLFARRHGEYECVYVPEWLVALDRALHPADQCRYLAFARGARGR